MDLLAFSQISTALNTYGHLLPNVLPGTKKQLDEFFNAAG